MTTIKTLVETLEKLDCEYAFLIDYNSCIWTIVDDDLYWNTDNNIEDLKNGDGNTYSGYLVEGYHEEDGYLMCNIDTQTGTWCTEIFKLDNKVDLDEL